MVIGLHTAAAPEQRDPRLPRNPTKLASELAVIVNSADPLSVKIGKYYQKRRNIPPENIISINISAANPVLSPEQFAPIYDSVMERTPHQVQFYALTWAAPYRVGCMSITSAFAMGYDEAYCAKGCLPTKASPYFNSESRYPFRHYRMRPTMALAGLSFADVKALIDRGVAADFSRPSGTAYLVSTSDKARNVRSIVFDATRDLLGRYVPIKEIESDALQGRPDVLFYFIGRAKVANIDSNRFLPGAIADHLTSTGGKLTDSRQMSSLRWLEAGATGSYGAVVEPCNFPQKFPHPGLVIDHYLLGNTLIEAYWKSVAWPGQGIFIGEPLANPFGVPAVVPSVAKD
jgi:uncharacterized protein (TIGR03790 family)